MTRLRVSLLGLVAALALVLVVTHGATPGGGGPAPGVVFGSPGVVTPNGSVRYLALAEGRQTMIVAQNSVGDVVHWAPVKHTVGVPLVTVTDGMTDGVSADGKTLVLATQPSYGVGAKTRFVILRLPSLHLRRVIELDGVWAFDAISPNGRTIVAAHYADYATTGAPSYTVRAINARTGRVYQAPIVDKRNPDEDMSGSPWARAYSPSRAWAYTLYVRPSGRSFVHALDTAHRIAYCIDLPWRTLGIGANLRLVTKPAARELHVLQGARLLAQISLDKLTVKAVAPPQ